MVLQNQKAASLNLSHHKKLWFAEKTCLALNRLFKCPSRWEKISSNVDFNWYFWDFLLNCVIFFATSFLPPSEMFPKKYFFLLLMKFWIIKNKNNAYLFRRLPPPWWIFYLVIFMPIFVFKSISGQCALYTRQLAHTITVSVLVKLKLTSIICPKLIKAA